MALTGSLAAEVFGGAGESRGGAMGIKALLMNWVWGLMRMIGECKRVLVVIERE